MVELDSLLTLTWSAEIDPVLNWGIPTSGTSVVMALVLIEMGERGTQSG